MSPSPPAPETTTVGIETTPYAGAARPAPPLLLIHGVGTDRTIWSRSIPLLSDRGPVVAVDLPGFGDSPAPGDGWELEEVADAVAGAVAERVDPPYDLVGSSLGGAVALTLAARRPELLGRLVLAAPAGFRPLPAPLSRVAATFAGPFLAARRLAGLRLADSAAARRALLAGTIADGAALGPEPARLMLTASEGASSLGPAIEAAVRADLTGELGRLRVPVGLIWGSLDRVIPPHVAERLLAVRPDLPLELVPMAGHIPHLEYPERFVAALERVMSRLP